MRLDAIAEARHALSCRVQPLPEGDFSTSVGLSFRLQEKEGLRRRIARAVAPAFHWAQQRQIRRQLGFELPYLAAFRQRFDVLLVVAKITPQGIAYRREHSDKWKRLRAAGLGEAELLVKSLCVVLRKPPAAVPSE